MDYQIRRGIFETSSSSASVMTMISDSGRRFDVKLDKTWICVRGCYNTSGDGIAHVYLNSWSDKMAFLADDTPIWHEMFKKTTGQDFVLYKLFSTPYEYKDAVDVHTIPDAIVPENRLDGYMQIVPELEYVCGVELTYLDNLVALPADTPDEFLQKYHLERVYSSIESYMDILELKEKGRQAKSEEEFLNKKLLGYGIKHPKIDDFIGNYVALSTKGSIIRLETYLAEGKPIKKSTHCGLTKDEMEVPVIVINKK